MDRVYVIYLDEKMYSTNSEEGAYLSNKYAEKAVEKNSKWLVHSMVREDGKYYHNLTEEEVKIYLDKAKKRFEIRTFIEEK